MKFQKLSTRLDGFGILASVICAIHCAFLPLLITTLPLWGIGFLANPWVEGAMICISLLLGSSSLSMAYLSHHKKLPLLLLCLGFASITLGLFMLNEYFEPYFVAFGGLTIAYSHYTNWRLMRLYNKNHLENVH
ncbi:MAG: MerC domain-containing protein [Sphingobacteriales bacterium]|nr:MAG: MerC domain-containing protein [Sphingobacteriales bacterium]